MFCKIVVTVFKNGKKLLFFLLSFRFIALEMEAPVSSRQAVGSFEQNGTFWAFSSLLQVDQVCDDIILELDQHQRNDGDSQEV